MFLINKPTDKYIRRFIAAQKALPLTYAEAGETRHSNPPKGYTVDNNRILLGHGRAAFDQAVEAIKRWEMFNFSWIKLCFNDVPIETGAAVALLIKHFGFWSLNAARIVNVMELKTESVEKFGFAYGTLPEHGERGEERFSVEYHRADESVWYDLYAFSQPNQLLAKIGYPLSRYLQKQFAVDSKQAMFNALKT